MKIKLTIIEPSGILDAIRGNQLRREVSDIVTRQTGLDVLLIDLKDVSFIDSSGLGALVSAMQIVRNANAKLFVCSASSQVKMLFELTKVDRIIQNFADRDEFQRHVLSVQ
ncbi:anti-sigma-factor antagonist [Tolypothrix tenuis PCC 7101]|uniref:Anti-sigma factor antagonist n=1 Tax=Tolypothrix tenuis PCC 7101 TaxID=231146 RepID=A0A1Z4MTM8_9CYAN|nr:STAS domain-containing protein [Aulosira sp. FACHB-113]BAY96809.1 anti-sigma-factor antagonist [Tolypothrix tenuis PCC 7101]BAZ72683.1 anti-sigma-factor antagonist [Aulosira laxa NIES-50]